MEYRMQNNFTLWEYNNIYQRIKNTPLSIHIRFIYPHISLYTWRDPRNTLGSLLLVTHLIRIICHPIDNSSSLLTTSDGSDGASCDYGGEQHHTIVVSWYYYYFLYLEGDFLFGWSGCVSPPLFLPAPPEKLNIPPTTTSSHLDTVIHYLMLWWVMVASSSSSFILGTNPVRSSCSLAFTYHLVGIIIYPTIILLQ